MQDTGYRIQHTRYRCKIQNTGYNIQDIGLARYRIQDKHTRYRCKIQDTGYNIQDIDARYGIQDTK